MFLSCCGQVWQISSQRHAVPIHSGSPGTPEHMRIDAFWHLRMLFSDNPSILFLTIRSMFLSDITLFPMDSRIKQWCIHRFVRLMVVPHVVPEVVGCRWIHDNRTFLLPLSVNQDGRVFSIKQYIAQRDSQQLGCPGAESKRRIRMALSWFPHLLSSGRIQHDFQGHFPKNRPLQLFEVSVGDVLDASHTCTRGDIPVCSITRMGLQSSQPLVD